MGSRHRRSRENQHYLRYETSLAIAWGATHKVRGLLRGALDVTETRFAPKFLV
jgi:hypothetical protein